MIYYSNSNLRVPHMTFIGRWSPFHRGHIAMIEKKRSEHPGTPVLVMVRDTGTDAFSAAARAEYIKMYMTDSQIQGTIMIVPNIEGVYWGRGVGYSVGQVNVPKSIEKISATRIREAIQQNAPLWNNDVAHKQSSYILTPSIAQMIESGLVIWLTGCPSSGKTTLANHLKSELKTRYPHIKTQILDGDEMRGSPLADQVGFSKQERANHIRRMAYLANLFANHGIVVICAFVSPDRAVRQEARAIIGNKRFIEVYVRASKTVRIRRDNKGLYRQAKDGHLPNLTGYNAIYEPPKRPEVLCPTDKLTVSSCVDRILTYMFTKWTG